MGTYLLDVLPKLTEEDSLASICGGAYFSRRKTGGLAAM
jgi:hypothetical protein